MEITKNTVYYVEFENEKYTRHSKDSWTIVMGESEEQVYDHKELEAEFQRVLAEISDESAALPLHGVIESIPIHDIRNKLSPVCNLIAMFGKPEYKKYIGKEIENCKKSINYLANREVYSL